MNQQPPYRPEPLHAFTALKLSTLTVGALIVLTGLAWLAGNMGLIDRDLVAHGWPLILVVIGVATLLSRKHDAVLSGLVMIAAGGCAFATEMQWLRVPFWGIFGPLVIVLLGGAVVWRAFNSPAPRVFATSPPPALEAPGFHASADPYLRIVSILSGSEERPMQPFAAAQMTAVVGGVKLDLRALPDTQRTITMDVFMVMGGAEIWVPADCEVIVKTVAFMGAVADKRRGPPQPPARQLILTGTILMAGIEIKD